MSLDVTVHSSIFATTGQVSVEDLVEIQTSGYRSLINNRPDFEGGDGQPTSDLIEASARSMGIHYIAQPFSPSQVNQSVIEEFAKNLHDAPKPILAFCRTGTRSTNIYQAAIAMGLLKESDLTLMTVSESVGLSERAMTEDATGLISNTKTHDIVIVGAGAGGVSLAASLLKRQSGLDIAVIEPLDEHFYQPAWTLVGAGEYEAKDTVRNMHAVIPHNVKWIKAAVTSFDPEKNKLLLSTGDEVVYQQLVISPGLACLWDSIPGLLETLGKNGVTSNYRMDLAEYTWECVKQLSKGVALFTQPMVPIKCAGAPQKALYLSAAHWEQKDCLKDIKIEFHNAGGALFSVEDFVPNLMKQMDHYNAHVNLSSTLVQVDGALKKAWFESKAEDGSLVRIEKSFDILHVVPPQKPHEFIKNSSLANDDGWVDVDQSTLQHTRYVNIFGLGDAISAPNSKTAAAVRKQVVVVAENLLAIRSGKPLPMSYDGYSACPITVGHGRLILAEFGYGGKLMPTFGGDPTQPRRFGWYLKKFFFPRLYWSLMLKGHEWLARPKKID